ncbi:MAG: flagellar hook-basal body complex protein, partial [Deltaproteobacteria bacterium]|nr:flagellar hook-basal body complex protein [Deltaproteobacteria bacterium]
GTGFDLNNPAATSNYNTSETVYDSKGGAHNVTLYFRKGASTVQGSTWEWYAVVPGTDTASGKTETQAQGTLSFDTSGTLVNESNVTYNQPSGGFDFSGSPTLGQKIDFNFGLRSKLGGTTSYANNSSTLSNTPDGYGSGDLTGLSVKSDGTITGSYSNNQDVDIAKVAIYGVIAPENLERAGGNNFLITANAGVETPVNDPTGKATKQYGTVTGSELETSNVDLSTELVNLIVLQQSFSSSSKIVTTSDQMLQTAIAMKT